MMTTKNLTLALALALGSIATGCAADAPSDEGGPSDSNDATDPSDPDAPDRDLDATGTYRVRSQLDLAASAPGQVGAVVNAIIDATDDGDDPTSWILDQVINSMGNGTFKSFLQQAKPFVAGYLNDRLLDFAPDFVTTMVQVGDDFGQIAKKFGLNETLQVAGNGSVHTVLGAHFKIDNIESDHAFADYGVANNVTEGVSVAVDQQGKLNIGEHTVSVAYGAVLRIGLDAAVIPLVDSSAENLGDLFSNLVDCNQVGEYIRQAIASYFGYGGAASLYATACVAGLDLGANEIYDQIADIDGTALELGISGQARGIDSNNDGNVDKIQTGAWVGNVSYAGTPAPLSSATFFGERM